MTDVALTSEQKKFLEECEEEFKDRYTEKDDAFMKIKLQESTKPPIVNPWYTKHSRPEWSHRDQSYDRRNRHWDRRNIERRERNERIERHGGKHFMHHRQRMY
ncbi:uncharacterized protein LOC109854308 [Pseudomyrmex gracilis]|uniref:uncharacterized protein LOC109854308 n=1 Tax=Pseudomyrmex gracilis TaxID=219809 RepID=UPI00099490F2|nr:uncharacterized protein LOC109854308 [Pseudomyrmex gracilis]XP_020282844.1 uncharacterized protein LOC109854308 [Pseudomyrmex gracilis]